MAELFEEVVALLESRSAARALAGEFRIESEQAAGNGAVLGVPVFLTSLARWAEDPSGSETLLSTLKTVETGGLQDPGAAIEARLYEPLGSDLVNMLLNGRRQRVAGAIAGEAGIGERSAAALLPPTAWAVMSSIADRYGNRLDRQSLIAILKQEERDLRDGGWGPWLQATDVGDPVVGNRRAALAGGAAGLGAAGLAGESADGGGSYPPPVARSARIVTESEQGRPVDERPRPAPQAATPMPQRSAQRPQHQRLPDPDLPYDLPEPKRSWLPFAAFGLLFLLGAGLLFLFLNSRGDDADLDQTAGGEAEVTESTEEPASSTPSSSIDDAAIADLPEELKVDLMLDDPAGNTAATGIVELSFDSANNLICYNLNVDGLGEPWRTHIHVGGLGVKGGIIVDFDEQFNGDIGCVDVNPVDMQSVLSDTSGHYFELHEPETEFTIRAQLSEAMADSGELAADAQYDPDGDGAAVKLESGTLTLEGPVADQAVVDRLLADFADVPGLEVVNNLAITPGAPLPSGRIVIDDAVLFGINSDVLGPIEGTVIEDLAEIFKARPTWTMAVVGHTDSTGTAAYNFELSLRRADAVREALIGLGVNGENLRTKGDGSSNPVADNATADGRAQNRRIEFEVDPPT